MAVSRETLIGMAGLAAIVAGPALADVKSGVDAWARGDYAAAVREWQGPAARGDADAQFNLAQAYKLGRGVRADLQRAEELYSLAAAQGHLQASDNYGLLLFQRGERARAVPYISAAADRGDARSQYLLGLAMFNGDIVAKDWVRGYALVSLARQNGLDQAGPALAQMDKYIPLDQRQQGVALAARLASAADANRARQLAAVELGSRPPVALIVPRAAAPTAVPAPVTMPVPVLANPRAGYDTPDIVAAENAILAAARVAGTDTPATAGADYARPATATPRPQIVTLPQVPIPGVAIAATAPPAAAAKPKASPTATPAPPKATGIASATTRAAPDPAPATPGPWRVQLGAFSVPGNADALWKRVSGRPELAGHARLSIKSGGLTKLQAGGFATRDAAQAACSKLSAAGHACLVTRS